MLPHLVGLELIRVMIALDHRNLFLGRAAGEHTVSIHLDLAFIIMAALRSKPVAPSPTWREDHGEGEMSNYAFREPLKIRKM
jgi:hypothetical protein